MPPPTIATFVAFCCGIDGILQPTQAARSIRRVGWRWRAGTIRDRRVGRFRADRRQRDEHVSGTRNKPCIATVAALDMADKGQAKARPRRVGVYLAESSERFLFHARGNAI